VRPTPADAVSSPLALAALVLLFVNDHELKQRWPGWLTGKLSDLAGLVLLPIVLLTLLELTRRRVSSTSWQARGCCRVAGAGFVLLECWSPASLLFRATLGVLQWPLRMLLAGHAVELCWVGHVPDREDLLALPALLLPWWYGARRARLARDNARRDDEAQTTAAQ
jgi:hypothetical protein